MLTNELHIRGLGLRGLLGYFGFFGKTIVVCVCFFLSLVLIVSKQTLELWQDDDIQYFDSSKQSLLSETLVKDSLYIYGQLTGEVMLTYTTLSPSVYTVFSQTISKHNIHNTKMFPHCYKHLSTCLLQLSTKCPQSFTDEKSCFTNSHKNAGHTLLELRYFTFFSPTFLGLIPSSSLSGG